MCVSMGRPRRPGTMEGYAMSRTTFSIFAGTPYPSYLGGAVLMRVPTLKNLQYMHEN